jgi:hypothetical protein
MSTAFPFINKLYQQIRVFSVAKMEPLLAFSSFLFPLFLSFYLQVISAPVRTAGSPKHIV